MTPEQFTYWLQGFAEITNSAPTEHEWKIIRDHLTLVFEKKTPNYDFTVPPAKMPVYLKYPEFDEHGNKFLPAVTC